MQTKRRHARRGREESFAMVVLPLEVLVVRWRSRAKRMNVVRE
jgi:hypothetical protein